MSRHLPVECPHGVTVDAGDFGHPNGCDEDHPGAPCPDHQVCHACLREQAQGRLAKVRACEHRWALWKHALSTDEPRLLQCAECAAFRFEGDDTVVC